MTTKTFLHSFHPRLDDSKPGSEVELSVEAIEAAGVREVLQAPGAALGSWSMLDVLLAKCDEFRFVEPLGQAREVKVALSGLFGRFVARAYLERYCGLHYFAHLGSEEIELGGRLGVRVSRRRGKEGDLPDWVACAMDLTGLTVAEAKGSHARSGPGGAIAQARKQVARVDVLVGQRRMAVKRIAVATRWGMSRDGPRESWIKVHDPVGEGKEFTTEEADAALLGVVRLHMVNLLTRLGHQALATAIREVTQAHTVKKEAAAEGRARGLLRLAAETDSRLGEKWAEAIGPAMIGGVVTRACPLQDQIAEKTDVSVLSRLNLRPVFVGISAEAVRAAIEGDTEYFRVRGRKVVTEPDSDSSPQLRAAGVVVPLD